MDWAHECELAKQFAVALVTRNGVPNYQAAQSQGEDIANMAFELARSFNVVYEKRTEEFSKKASNKTEKPAKK